MIKIILIILFLIVLFQDMKWRSVHWSLFPLMFCCSVYIGIQQIEIQQWGFSLLFIIFLLLSLTLYLTFRTGALVNITDGFFSWGDILFLIVIIPIFDLSSYMLVFTIGTLLTLVIHAIITQFDKKETIPYAGYMAFITSFYLIFETSIIHFKSILI
jgi:hypothetical protein